MVMTPQLRERRFIIVRCDMMNLVSKGGIRNKASAYNDKMVGVIVGAVFVVHRLRER